MEKSETRIRKKDHLIQLIHSLNANEKRYFKLYVSLQKGNKKYVTLFDSLSQMERYDAIALCKQLNKSPKQLSDEKNYLEEVLMKALHSFHSEATYRGRCFNNLIEVDILANKGLFDHAMSYLAKFKKTMPNDDSDIYCYLIASKESSLLLQASQNGRKKEKAAKSEEVLRRMEALLLNVKLFNISAELLELALDLNYLQDKTILKKAAKLVKETDKLIGRKQLSPRDYLRYCISVGNYYLHMGVDIGKSIKIYESGLKIYEAQNKLFRQTTIRDKYVLLTGLVQAFYLLQDYETTRIYIAKMQAFAAEGNSVSHFNSAIVSSQQHIFILMAEAKYKDALSYIQVQEVVIKKLQPPEDNVSELVMMKAACQFHLHLYHESLGTLMPLLALDAPIQHPETQVMARALSLMLHYELGNITSLRSYYQAALRYLQKKKFMSQEVITFTELIKHLIRGKDKKIILSIRKKLAHIYAAKRFELIGDLLLMPWINELARDL